MVLCATRWFLVYVVTAVRYQIAGLITVERFPKLDVVGSSPISRSKNLPESDRYAQLFVRRNPS